MDDRPANLAESAAQLADHLDAARGALEEAAADARAVVRAAHRSALTERGGPDRLAAAVAGMAERKHREDHAAPLAFEDKRTPPPPAPLPDLAFAAETLRDCLDLIEREPLCAPVVHSTLRRGIQQARDALVYALPESWHGRTADR